MKENSNLEKFEGRSEQGFTMIELVVVIAIMGIISALIVPAFNNMSTKAKLTTDVTTVKTLQRQIDIYKTEQELAENFIDKDTDLTSANIKTLVDAGYLEAKDLQKQEDGSYMPRLQTGGKITAEADDMLVLDLDVTGVNAAVKKYASELAETSPLKTWIEVAANTGEETGNTGEETPQ